MLESFRWKEAGAPRGAPLAEGPQVRGAGLPLRKYLGKYVSFSDEVMVDDIARGMQAAVEAEIRPKLAEGERFACITHSTGGPVVRNWVTLFYGDKLDRCPLSHLVMLAPANHGSALAQLGKGKLARMKSWFTQCDGVTLRAADRPSIAEPWPIQQQGLSNDK